MDRYSSLWNLVAKLKTKRKAKTGQGSAHATKL